jgi:integrase
MAYFRKLPSGSWRAEVEVQGHRETRGGFATKGEAREWAAQVEADARAGSLGKWPAKTLDDALERYSREVSSGKGSSRFELGLIARIRRDFPALCALPFSTIPPDKLNEWMQARLGQVKPATVQREANMLRNVWTVGAKVWRWCPMDSPWAYLKQPGKQPPRTRRVHWTEARRVLRRLGYITSKPPHNTQSQIAHAWLIALRTAMRSGEILGLTRAAVNLETRVVRLDKHKTQHHTGRPRFVPITKQAARLLGVLCVAAENRQKTGKKPAENRQEDERLFTVTAASKDALFRRAVDSCGIVGMTFHDSRAEALTLLSRRVDLLTLQKISGHADVNVLVNSYYRATPEQIAARL